MPDHAESRFYRATRGLLARRYAARVTLFAALAALGPLIALAAALALTGAGPALSAGLGAGALAAAAAALLAVRALLRPVEAIGASLADFAARREDARAAEDAVGLIARGAAELSRRLDAAARRGDPTRLEDPVTGLPNRLALMRRGRDEITRCRRKADGLSVSVLALEAETGAPQPGPPLDAALRIAAEALTQSLRAYDVVGRWDGARFAAMLPEAEIEHAVAAIRRAEADVRAAFAGEAREGLALHAGVAVLQPDDATLADIAARAEAALARAVARGVPVEAAPGPRSRPARLSPVE